MGALTFTESEAGEDLILRLLIDDEPTDKYHEVKMATYTEMKQALDEIAERTTGNSQRVVQAKSLLTASKNDLSAMQGAYASIVSDIDSAAAANPGNSAYQAAKAEKDLMVTDFQTLKAEVDALVTAVNS